jgi:hypothetical protein
MDDFMCAAVDLFFAIRDPLTLGKRDGVRLHEVLQQFTLRVTLRGNAEVQLPPWLITGGGLFFSIVTVRPVDFPRPPTGLSGAMLARTGHLTESRQFLYDLMVGGDVQRVLLLEVRQLIEVL